MTLLRPQSNLVLVNDEDSSFCSRPVTDHVSLGSTRYLLVPVPVQSKYSMITSTYCPYDVVSPKQYQNNASSCDCEVQKFRCRPFVGRNRPQIAAIGPTFLFYFYFFISPQHYKPSSIASQQHLKYHIFSHSIVQKITTGRVSFNYTTSYQSWSWNISLQYLVSSAVASSVRTVSPTRCLPKELLATSHTSKSHASPR